MEMIGEAHETPLEGTKIAWDEMGSDPNPENGSDFRVRNLLQSRS